MTRLAAALLALLLIGGPAAAPDHRRGRLPSAPTAHTAVPLASTAAGYGSPVEPVRVLRPFQPPPTPYAAGHRGVDLAAPAGAVVAAAGPGRVTFAGPVAGRGVVVIVHPDGISTEYEPIAASVRTGASVGRGDPIGRLHGTHGRCPSDRCLHWGARRGGVYFDPLTLLARLGPVRLLPWTP